MEDQPDTFTMFILNYFGLILAAILIFFVVLLFYTSKYKSSLRKDLFSEQHVVVTGGSSGIGLSVAVLAAKKGANVTIIAQNLTKLKAAKEEIVKACLSPLQRIVAISLDVRGDPAALTKALAEAEEGSGPVFTLVNCAGSAVCGRIEDTSVEDFKYMMDLNYYGTVYPTKAVITGMKERRRGHIVITASQAGMVGLYGFAAYSASKFALRGFAEALDMEVRPYGVSVTVCLPPDTDTPGFANEQKSKPMETKLICQTAGLFSPDDVAKQLLDDCLAGKFFSTVGFEGFLLTTGCAGMSPFSSILELISQISLMGLIRLISVYYLHTFHSIVRKCMEKKDSSKKSE